MPRVIACLALVLVVAPEARPCSPPCGVRSVVPAGGEVPANLPALAWTYQGPWIGSDAPVLITEWLGDGTSRPLPVTIEYGGEAGMTPRLARFGRPLVPGATYTVEILDGCWSPPVYVTSTFRAVAEAPLPSSLGRVRVAPRSYQVVAPVWTSSGSCTSAATVVARDVEVSLSGSAWPWRNALVGQWYRGGLYLARLGDVVRSGPTDPEAAWKDWVAATPYHVCSSADPGVHPGAPEGVVKVALRATIPGSDGAVLEASSSVELICDDPDNSPFPVEVPGGSGGCGAGGGGLVGWGLGGLWLVLRGRRRAR